MAKKKEKEAELPAESSGGSIAVNDAWTGLLAISLLALVIGTGFLAWDYSQYWDDDVKKVQVPKLTGTSPGAPAKVEPAKEQDKKEPEKKEPEKKE
jgi:hypothetical protein